MDARKFKCEEEEEEVKLGYIIVRSKA